MTPIEKYQRLERQIAAYEKRINKAEASRDVLMDELRTKQGASSLKHAAHLLKTAKERQVKYRAALEEGLDAFEEQFGETLRGKTEEDE